MSKDIVYNSILQCVILDLFSVHIPQITEHNL